MLCRVYFHQVLFWISGFMIIILELLTSCFATYVLSHRSLALLLFSYHTMSIPYLISLALYLLAPVCLCSRHSFQYTFMIQIYRYTCAYLCTPFGISITTRRGVLTRRGPHVQVSKLGACRFSQLLIRDAQQ